MMVNLEGVRVLVIGGGEEGRKKVEILSLFGAKITLIATDAQEEADIPVISSMGAGNKVNPAAF
jgi:uroporphyrin-III C-methyltransferase/precorrin-2 dehydrogenase/sirohydrochlorin ferrochelatase/precorrin-2 dehydrogenase/sirohydrochlorin ferrochelatase